ncbi:sensor histidine kinase [uncultured Ruthenibacterium sp.]|uniref:sensor histidine kinase n=1 Tax=uncultured Ruthenibacterium sp. TaxID=1905347 RepID=UPI00349EF9A4
MPKNLYFLMCIPLSIILLLFNHFLMGIQGVFCFVLVIILITILSFKGTIWPKIAWPFFTAALMVSIDYAYSCILFWLVPDLNLQQYIYEDHSWLFVCNAFATRFLITWAILIVSKKRFYYTNTGWLGFTAVPALGFISFLSVFHYASKSSGFQDPFFFIMAVLLLLIVVTSFVQFHMISKYSYEAALTKAQLKLDSLKKQQYHRLIEKYDAMRGWKHDIRNHLRTVAGIMEGGDITDAKQYLENLTSYVEHQTFSICSDNTALDAILGAKIEEAVAEDIAVSLDLHIPPIPVEEIDICTIIGNVWDNAIHASLKLPPEKRKIEFRIENTENFCRFICKNFKVAGPKMSNVSSGLGLSQIASTVKKYNGLFEYEDNGDQWVTTVMLPVKNLTDSKIKIFIWNSRKTF